MKARVPEETDVSLPEEGIRGNHGDHRPMRDLKEAVAKFVTQARCEPLGGVCKRTRYPRLPKSNILSVSCMCIGGEWAKKATDLTR